MSDTRLWTVARADLRDARQSRLLWGALALLFLLVVPGFWSTTGNLRVVEGVAPSLQAVARVPSYVATSLFVLVVALAYGSVAGERESGAIRSLLSLPATRRDVLAGKLLSRALLTVATVGPLLVLLGAIVVVQQGTLPPLAFALVAGWVLAYALGWTAFAVGVSAAFGSQYRALAAIVGTYLVFAWNSPIWKAVLEPGLRAALPPGLHPFVDSLNPTVSLLLVGRWLAAPETHLAPDVGVVAVAVSAGVLLLVGPAGLVVGYWRFERADLG